MTAQPPTDDTRPAPRLYLVTPRFADPAAIEAALVAALDAGDVAAVLLRPAEADERTLIRNAKALAAPIQRHGAAAISDGHPEIVGRAGLDGAHLTGLDAFREAAEGLKPERIAGCGGLATRHDAMLVAEAGADYVMFGEPDRHGARPAFAAIVERAAWWAEVFEIPCVAYADSPDEVAPLVATGADFIALGEWVWSDPRGAAAAVRDASAQLALETLP